MNDRNGITFVGFRSDARGSVGASGADAATDGAACGPTGGGDGAARHAGREAASATPRAPKPPAAEAERPVATRPAPAPARPTRAATREASPGPQMRTPGPRPGLRATGRQDLPAGPRPVKVARRDLPPTQFQGLRSLPPAPGSGTPAGPGRNPRDETPGGDPGGGSRFSKVRPGVSFPGEQLAEDPGARWRGRRPAGAAAARECRPAGVTRALSRTRGWWRARLGVALPLSAVAVTQAAVHDPTAPRRRCSCVGAPAGSACRRPLHAWVAVVGRTS